MKMTKLFVLLTVALLALSCASSSKHKRTKKLPPPPSGESTTKGAADEHFDEIKKAAAEQLECPIEQILVQCTQRDRDENCIAVKATGCERSFEYQFGNE